MAASDVVIVASPTYKATYTGLLKVFLDRFPHQGLGGVTAIPLMLGAADTHALAVEHGLRPLLVELGASVPTRGLFVLDSEHADAAPYDRWFAGAEHAPAHPAHPDPVRRCPHDPVLPVHHRRRARPAHPARRLRRLPVGRRRRGRLGQGPAHRHRGVVVHLGEHRPAAGVVLDLDHQLDLAAAARGRPPRHQRAGRPPRRGVPPARRAARGALRRPALPGHRERRRSCSTRPSRPTTARCTRRSSPATT